MCGVDDARLLQKRQHLNFDAHLLLLLVLVCISGEQVVYMHCLMLRTLVLLLDY